jgi:hypothetical protein
MKSRQKVSGRVTAGAKRKELKLKIAIAQKHSETARVRSQAAKAGFKIARKTFKKAKKLAREARKKLKALKKALIKATQAARKPPARAARKIVKSPKPVVTEPVLPPAAPKPADKIGTKKHPAARTTLRTVPKRPGPPAAAVAAGFPVIMPKPAVISPAPEAAPQGEKPDAPPTIPFPETDSPPKPPAA